MSLWNEDCRDGEGKAVMMKQEIKKKKKKPEKETEQEKKKEKEKWNCSLVGICLHNHHSKKFLENCVEPKI